jgi:hypothetical protein
MAMFLGMITFLLALATFAGALVLWHHGRQGAGLVRAAGAVLGVGAVLTTLCTVYFMVVYRLQGELDHAYPHATMHRGMMGPCMMEEGMMGRGMMGKGMMGPGMMGPGMMGPGMMGAGGMSGSAEGSPERPSAPAPETDVPPGHEEHHPEGE